MSCPLIYTICFSGTFFSPNATFVFSGLALHLPQLNFALPWHHCHFALENSMKQGLYCETMVLLNILWLETLFRSWEAWICLRAFSYNTHVYTQDPATLFGYRFITSSDTDPSHPCCMWFFLPSLSQSFKHRVAYIVCCSLQFPFTGANAGGRLHNIFVFHNSRHVTLGDHSAINSGSASGRWLASWLWPIIIHFLACHRWGG